MDMNTNLKLLSGNYNLEVLTIPRMQISQVSIKQSSTTTVKIEVPGVLNLVKTFPGYGAIFIDEDGRLAKIYGLNENLANELVGLQAGEYTLVFRGKSSKKTTDSITRRIRIKSGESLQLKL
jgi:Ca-activated chloride channel family protein